VLTEYLLHYNTARPRRSLGQLTPDQADSRPPDPVNLAEHRIRRKQVLGGLTHEYYIAALPPSGATENAGHGPNRISEPHRSDGRLPATVPGLLKRDGEVRDERWRRHGAAPQLRVG
jgi:hypothetical protein